MAKFRSRTRRRSQRTGSLPSPKLTPEHAAILEETRKRARAFVPFDVQGDFLDNAFRNWLKGYGFDLDFGKSRGTYIRKVFTQGGAPQATIGGAGFTNRSLRELTVAMSEDASVSPQNRQTAASVAEAIQAHDTRQRVTRLEQKGPASVRKGTATVTTEPQSADVYDLDGNQYVVRMPDGRTRPLEITQADMSATMAKGVPPPFVPKGTKKSGEPKDPIFLLEYGVRTGVKSKGRGVDLPIDVVRNAMARMGLKTVSQRSMNNVGIIDPVSGEFVTRGISNATTKPRREGVRQQIFEIYKRDLNQPGNQKLLSQSEREIPFSEKGGASDLPPGDVIIKDPETGRYMFRTRGGEMMGLDEYKARYPGNKKVARVVEALEDPNMQDPVAALESGVTRQPKTRPTDLGKRLDDENNPEPATASLGRPRSSFGGEREKSPADEAADRSRFGKEKDQELPPVRRGKLGSNTSNVTYRDKQGNLQVGRNYNKEVSERDRLLLQLVAREAQKIAARNRASGPQNLKRGKAELAVQDAEVEKQAINQIIADAAKDGIDFQGSPAFRGRGLGSQYNPETGELQLARVRGNTDADVTPLPSTRVLPPKGLPAEVSRLGRPNPLGTNLSVTKKSKFNKDTYTQKTSQTYMETSQNTKKELEWLRTQLDPTVTVRSSPGKTQFNPEGSSRLVTGARERSAGILEGSQINVGKELRERLVGQYRNALERQKVKPAQGLSILESGTHGQHRKAFASVLRQNRELRGNQDLVRSIIVAQSELAGEALLRGVAKEAGKGRSLGRNPAALAAQNERNPLSYFRFMPGEGPGPDRKVSVGLEPRIKSRRLRSLREAERVRGEEAAARAREAESGRGGGLTLREEPLMPTRDESPAGRMRYLLQNLERDPEARRNFEARARRNALLLGDSLERQLMELMGTGLFATAGGYYPPPGRRQLRPTSQERMGYSREEAIRQLMALSRRASRPA